MVKVIEWADHCSCTSLVRSIIVECGTHRYGYEEAIVHIATNLPCVPGLEVVGKVSLNAPRSPMCIAYRLEGNVVFSCLHLLHRVRRILYIRDDIFYSSVLVDHHYHLAHVCVLWLSYLQIASRYRWRYTRGAPQV